MTIYKNIQVICPVCNDTFTTKSGGKRATKTCSKISANKLTVLNTNLATKNEKIKSYAALNRPIQKLGTAHCICCNKEFNKNYSTHKYCSRRCVGQTFGSKHGILSASIKCLRSKNEIYFADLCKNTYRNTETNSNIFNGWDADVIIHDLKVAILWNGIWHYKDKIRHNHSLAQVKNRDKIKIKNIMSCGYTPYVIKDLGKHNKDFVEKQFAILRWIYRNNVGIV